MPTEKTIAVAQIQNLQGWLGISFWQLEQIKVENCKVKSAQEACTGKSLSEALIFAAISPQYENRLSMKLPWKLQAQNMGRTCSAHVLIMFCACSFHGNSMNNLLSYCGLVDPGKNRCLLCSRD